MRTRFAYPVFVKPAGTGSSVGVAKAKDRAALEAAIEAALKYDRKVLVEEFISGQEVEVAVLGNDNPFASICGEIDSGAEFTTMTQNISPTAPTCTSRPAFPSRPPSRCVNLPCASTRPWAAAACPALTSL